MNENIVSNERFIYSELVKYKSFKFTTKLYITNKKISFLKKGLFNNNYKEFAYIDIKDKTNNKVEVNNVEDRVSIETETKTYDLLCRDEKEARKLTSKLKEAISGDNKLDKTKKIMDKVGKSLVSLSGIALTVLGVAITLKNNSKKIYKGFKTLIRK